MATRLQRPQRGQQGDSSTFDVNTNTSDGDILPALPTYSAVPTEADEEEAEEEDEDNEEGSSELRARQPLHPIPLTPVDYEPEAPFPPPGLKEISSLASWTVSSAKPGNGVVALRSPDHSLYWQSDGPQPHTLSIHFFKLVHIVHMRIYLDWDADESYTPTKIQFWAGTAEHDLIEFAEMSFEQPKGWIEVDFSGVGPVEDDESEDEEVAREVDWSKRPVLHAFLVHVKIIENHQSGKDTHLRGVQLFARDESHQPAGRRMEHAGAEAVVERKAAELARQARARGKRVPVRIEQNNISRAEWMRDPTLR